MADASIEGSRHAPRASGTASASWPSPLASRSRRSLPPWGTPTCRPSWSTPLPRTSPRRAGSSGQDVGKEEEFCRNPPEGSPGSWLTPASKGSRHAPRASTARPRHHGRRRWRQMTAPDDHCHPGARQPADHRRVSDILRPFGWRCCTAADLAPTSGTSLRCHLPARMWERKRNSAGTVPTSQALKRQILPAPSVDEWRYGADFGLYGGPPTSLPLGGPARCEVLVSDSRTAGFEPRRKAQTSGIRIILDEANFGVCPSFG